MASDALLDDRFGRDVGIEKAALGTGGVVVGRRRRVEVP